MKNWTKIVIVVVCMGLSGGLSFSASLWTNLAVPLSLFASGITALMGVIVGWTPTTN